MSSTSVESLDFDDDRGTSKANRESIIKYLNLFLLKFSKPILGAVDQPCEVILGPSTSPRMLLQRLQSGKESHLSSENLCQMILLVLQLCSAYLLGFRKQTQNTPIFSPNGHSFQKEGHCCGFIQPLPP